MKAFFKKSSELTLEEKDMSVRGWNWGKANFIGNALHFDVEGQVDIGWTYLWQVPTNVIPVVYDGSLSPKT